MRNLEYEDIEIVEIFDEVDSLLFFCFKLKHRVNTLKKGSLFIAVLADYDIDLDEDIYLVSQITRKDYQKLIHAEIQIRSLFSNSKNRFLIKDMFNSFKVSTVNLSDISGLYPDDNVYIQKVNGSYIYVDKKEIQNEVDRLNPLHVIESTKMSDLLFKSENRKNDYLYVAFGHNDMNMNSEVLGKLLTTFSKVKDEVCDLPLSFVPTHSFEGSFGLSFKIEEEELITEKDLSQQIKELNNLITILNTESYIENPQLISNVFGTKVAKTMQDFLTLLIDNMLDVKTLYVDANRQHMSAGFLNIETLKEIKHNILSEKIIDDSEINIEGRITKIDIKNKSFGFSSDFGYITGKISDELINKFEFNGIDFKISDVNNATFIKRKYSKGMSAEEKIVNILHDIEY